MHVYITDTLLSCLGYFTIEMLILRLRLEPLTGRLVFLDASMGDIKLRNLLGIIPFEAGAGDSALHSTSGFGTQGLSFRLSGFGSRVGDFGFRLNGVALRFTVGGLRLRV